MGSGLDGFADEAACVRELKESSQFGALYLFDQVLQDSIDAGKAEYDGEAAEGCARPLLEAVNSCDANAYVSQSGALDVNAALFAPSADPECRALGARGFARGKVKDGGECTSNFDCADFGRCVVDSEDTGEPSALTGIGTCVAALQEGENCGLTEAACSPGLRCAAGNGAPICAKLKENGEPCDQSSECGSGSCASSAAVSGTCAFSGASCEDNEDCDVFEDEACERAAGNACVEPQEVKREICDGA